MKRRLAYFIGGVVVLVIVFTGLNPGTKFSRWRAAAHWPTVSAVLVDQRQVTERYRRDSGRNSGTFSSSDYRTETRTYGTYEYSVDDRSYRVEFQDRNEGLISSWMQHSVPKELTILVNPREPAEAVRSRSDLLIDALSGLLLLLGGLWSIAVSIFSSNPDDSAIGRLLDDD